MNADHQDEFDSEEDAGAVGEPGVSIGCTVSGLAQLAGVVRSTVQGWTKKADFPQRLPDKSLNPFAVGVWYERRRLEKKVEEAEAADPMAANDGTSPELERWRRARRILTEMDVSDRQKSTINMQSFMERMLGMAAIRRRTNDLLQRRFGREAHEIMARGLQEEEREWHRIFEEHYGNHLRQTGKKHALDEGPQDEPTTETD